MAEMDAFDRSLADAFDRLVDRIPGEVDAAAVAHRVARERQPRRVGPFTLGTISLGPLAAPRAAWLVVASLLVAALAAALFAGSRPDPVLPAVLPVVPPLECPAGSNPDAPGPAHQERPPLTFTSPMAFDRRAGRIVTLVARDSDREQTWTFDVCTNTWTRMSDGPISGGWDQLVYDAKHDLTITVDSGTRRVWAYDLESDTWTARGLAHTGAYGGSGRPRFVYDPVAGLVLEAFQAKGPTDTDLWAYDVGTNTWTEISAAGFSSNVLLGYDASVDRLVAYDWPVASDWSASGGNVTKLYDPRQRTWTASSAVTPPIDVNWFATGYEIAYDETARQTVILNHGRLIAYDAAADRWTEVLAGTPGEGLCPGPRCRFDATTVYDPVNERLVLYGGMYQVPGTDDWVQDDGVLAFDLATRTWTTLLEPTRTEPAG